MPVWHASAVYIDARPREPLRVEIHEWTPEQRRLIKRRLDSLLAGVGEGPEMWHEGDRTLHVRRSTTAGERALIDPAWLAVPATDVGGGEDLIRPSWQP